VALRIEVGVVEFDSSLLERMLGLFEFTMLLFRRMNCTREQGGEQLARLTRSLGRCSQPSL